MAGGITMVVIGVLVAGFCALTLIGDWMYGFKVEHFTPLLGIVGVSLVVNGIRFILKAARRNEGTVERTSQPEGWYDDPDARQQV